MPITPLHFGLLAPINHFAPKKVNNVSFILVNLVMDYQAIVNWFSQQPLPSHLETSHTLYGAAIYAVIIGVFGIRSMPWVLGAFLGGISHIFLDSLVHLDMNPLWPMEGNPFYMGWMEPLSWILLPLTVWLIFQYVSGIRGWVQRRLVV